MYAKANNWKIQIITGIVIPNHELIPEDYIEIASFIHGLNEKNDHAMAIYEEGDEQHSGTIVIGYLIDELGSGGRMNFHLMAHRANQFEQYFNEQDLKAMKEFFSQWLENEDDFYGEIETVAITLKE